MNRTGILLTVVMIAVSATCAWAQAPAAGPNVNMVSGTDWTTGDPFLQRQNEPSIAVSTRNSSHLLAGANDYRSVDFEILFGDVNGEQTPDAWLGVFKSFDGGATWASTLLPGFPGDTSAAGLASPLSLPRLQAAADPIVRAGANGMFYYAGIAFQRPNPNGTNNLGKVFVARFIDNNNKENGDPIKQTPGTFTAVSPTDPIRYLGTSVVQSGTSAQFLDKPWLAVDVPRGSATCRINFTNPDGTSGSQTIPASNVYLTFSDFVNNSTQSAILFTRSTNCGSTWSSPIALSPIAVNQGSVIAVAPPIPGTENLLPPLVYVAWRRFGSGNTPSAIMMAESLNGGANFTPAFAAYTFPLACNTTPTGAGCPFDQGITGTSFRTNSYPTMAADTTGRVYLAWSQRQANGDARIMMQVGLVGIPLPPPVLVDNGPVRDDSGNALAGLSGRGHQIMPSLTFNAGKLMLIYYDLRQDHTIGQFTPLLPSKTGYSETRFFEGELTTNPADPSVFNFFIDDAGAPTHPLVTRRHTIDLQGAQASPRAPLNLTVPAFSAFRIAHYQFGLNPYDGSTIAEQLEVNPPNLPMFQQGHAPFMGDYIDVAGAPPFVLKNGSWHFNTDATAGPPVFHAAWADNRNVRPPTSGDWTKYTPPISASNPGSGLSKFDPSKTVLTCNPDFVASRNQDIYTARIAPGLVVAAPGNQKTLGNAPNTTTLLQRAFSVVVQNTTNVLKTFRLTIANQPLLANGTVDPRGQATFQQIPATPTVTTLDVQVNPLSSISRSVFVKSQNPTASVTVNVQEVTGVGGTLVSGGLTSTTVINPDPTTPAIINPDNPSVGNPSIGNSEVYNPSVGNPSVGNPSVGNTELLNPSVGNPSVGNPSVGNPSVGNPSVGNQAVSAALNPSVGNPSIGNPSVGNPSIGNPSVGNQSVTDASYTLTNTGNTTATYSVKLFGPNLPNSLLYQLILNKVYYLNQPGGVGGCTLELQPTNVILSNIPNPTIETVASNLGNPSVGNPSVGNATVAVPPGETVQVTLRISPGLGLPPLTPQQVQEQVLNNVTPVAVSQAVNTQNLGQVNPQPPISLTITTKALPNANLNAPYSQQLAAIGGVINPPTTNYHWTPYSGSLPAGLTLDATGLIHGTPTAGGTYPFVVQVADAALPTPHMAQQALSIVVVAPLSFNITPATQTATVGQFFSEDLSTFTSGGVTPYTYTVSAGSVSPFTLTGSTISGTPAVAGSTGLFTVKVTDHAGTFTSSSQTINIINPVSINSIQPSTTVADGFGQLITLFTSGIPNSGQSAVTFTQGTNSQQGFVFMTGADVTYVRLPTAVSLNPGAASVTVTNTSTGVTSAPFPITVSTTPAAPVENFIYGLSTPPAPPPPPTAPCGGGQSASPVSTVAPGQGLVVYAYGTDTQGPTVVFSDGVHNIPVTPTCSVGNPNLGIGSIVTVPSGLNAGPISVSIETTVNGNTSALSNPISLTLVPISFTPPLTQTIAVGQAFSEDLTSYTSGGLPPYNYSITGGSLPPNLSLTGSTISGTAAGGSFAPPYDAPSWTATASNGGTTSITPNCLATVAATDTVGGSAKANIQIGTTPTSACAAFSYAIDLNNPPGSGTGGSGVSARTWTFQNTAATTGTLTFHWHYTGFHAFFQVTALLQIFSGSNTITLYSAGPAICCTTPSAGFDVQGTGTIAVTAGQPFGFTVGGSNGDSNSVLNGILDITNFAIHDASTSTVGNMTVQATDVIYAAGSQSSVAAAAGGTVPGAITLPSQASSVSFPSVQGSLTSACASWEGCVSINIGTGSNQNDPDGAGSATSTSSNTGSGSISGMTAPGAGYLVGVFIGPGGPSGTAPPALDFTSSGIGTSFTTLSPLLNQVFFIGDGLTGDGTGAVQSFNVPAGATQLYLGISDAPFFNGGPGAYSDNSGSYPVTYAVTAPPRLTVTPGNNSLTLGQTQQFTATVTYANGSSSDVTNSVTWTSSDTDRLPINSTGLASAYNEDDPLGPGTPVTITATLGALTGSSLWHVALLPSVGGFLQPYSCSLEGHIRSLSGQPSSVTSINFTNDSSATRQTFWLDYGGNRVLYNGSLTAGSSYLQGTYLTHPWVTADPSGNCIQIYVNPDITGAGTPNTALTDPSF